MKKKISIIFILVLTSIDFLGKILFSFIETAKAGTLFSICCILKINLGESLLLV